MNMAKRQRVAVAGRAVWVVTGSLSQTINVCTPANKQGRYDWIVRLSLEFFVGAEDVEAFQTVEQLIEWLTEKKSGYVEKQPSEEFLDEEIAPPVARETASVSLDEIEWIEHAIRLTEMCIDELVWEFLEIPYLHRVEHSVHVRLYELLRTQPFLNRHFPIKGGMLTQPIHKEWPETEPRPEKGNRRGNFDLAVLSPARLQTIGVREFSEGRAEPAIVIEMGLNYCGGHLVSDAEKMINSSVRKGYLVHLVREQFEGANMHATIKELSKNPSIKVAYARYANGKKEIKLLNDPDVRSIV